MVRRKLTFVLLHECIILHNKIFLITQIYLFVWQPGSTANSKLLWMEVESCRGGHDTLPIDRHEQGWAVSSGQRRMSIRVAPTYLKRPALVQRDLSFSELPDGPVPRSICILLSFSDVGMPCYAMLLRALAWGAPEAASKCLAHLHHERALQVGHLCLLVVQLEPRLLWLPPEWGPHAQHLALQPGDRLKMPSLFMRLTAEVSPASVFRKLQRAMLPSRSAGPLHS